MKNIYKKNYEPNCYGEVKKTMFGWEWKLFRNNEAIPFSQGKEKHLENAILLCDHEANRLVQIFFGWTLVQGQETSHESPVRKP